jgi:hypothetical protein
VFKLFLFSFAQIDLLLTPTQRKLQAGTRAVARQLTNDILPFLANSRRRRCQAVSSGDSTLRFPAPPSPDDFSRIGNRVFNALNNQMRKNLDTLQSDLADPTRIPKLISQQTEDLVKKADNVFSETPVGLKEPKYTVVSQTESYEIRDYKGYTVASTNMGSDTDTMSLTEQGAAFTT